MLDRLKTALGLDTRAPVGTIERALAAELKREEETARDAEREQLGAEIERLARERDTAIGLQELEIAQLQERRRVRVEEDAIDAHRIGLLEAEKQGTAAAADAQISRLARRLELSAPTILRDFLTELRELAREASAQRRFTAGGELIRDFWSNRAIPSSILSNREAVDRLLNAIRQAERGVADLQRRYLPLDQLSARIAELRASIPDLSTCDEMLEETGDAA
jgi:hypothetical protein